MRVLLLCILMFVLSGCGGGDAADPEPAIPPPVTQLPAMPAAEFETQSDYLQSFFKLANIVRYYHPGDAVNATDWEAFLTESAYLIATAADETAAEHLIWQQLSQLAPDLHLNQHQGLDRKLDEVSSFRVWQQNGYQDEDPAAKRHYNRRRLTVSQQQLSNQPELPLEYQYTYSDRLITAIIPLVSAVSANNTVPVGQPFIRSTRFQLPTKLQHPMVCLASVAEVWGIVQHFFPYFSTVTVDWQAELEAMMRSCQDPDRRQFDKQLHLSLTKLEDNHVRLSTPFTLSRLGNYMTPVRFDWIEGKLVAVYKMQTVTDIALGDELLEVNGQPVHQVIAELALQALVSPHRAANIAAVTYLLRGNQNTPFELMLKNQSGDIYYSTQRSDMSLWIQSQAVSSLTFNGTPQYQELEGDIGYVNLAATLPADVAPTISKLRSKKAVVLDLRNYPEHWQGWSELITAFAGEPVDSGPMYYHFSNHPEPALRYRKRVPQTIYPQNPPMLQPMVVISSRYSISQNEHALLYAQNAGIPVLGEASFGVNGEITEYSIRGGFDLGGITGFFTGMEVTQNDHSPLLGVGIQPDLPVPLTVEGIRQQTDVQLEAARQYLLQQLQQASDR